MIVELAKRGSGPVGRWAEALPPDMLAFYKDLNGCWFRWSFVGDDGGLHGPRFNSLMDDGHNVLHLSTGHVNTRIGRVREYAIPLVHEDGSPFPPEDRTLHFEGEWDAGSTLLQLREEGGHAFHRMDSACQTTAAGESFAELVHRGLDSGFAYLFQLLPEHPRVAQVRARLASPVAPRETFSLRVEDRSELSASAWRERLGARLRPADLDAVAKALKRTERAKGLEAEARGRLFDEMTRDPKAIDAAAAKVILKAVGSRETGKGALAEALRHHGRPAVALTLRLRFLDPRGGLPLMEEVDTLVRVLHEHPGLRVTEGFPADPRLLSAAYLPRLGITWTPFLEVQTVQRWTGRGQKEAVYQVLLESERAVGLEPGLEVLSSALASVL